MHEYESLQPELSAAMGVPSMRILQNPYENMVQWLAQHSLGGLKYQKIQRGIVGNG